MTLIVRFDTMQHIPDSLQKNRTTGRQRMHEPIRVLIVGTGQMGSGIARLVRRRPGLALVGAYGRRAERVGQDLGPAIGLPQPLGIPISGDLQALVEQTRPQVAIQATCSMLTDAMAEISTLLRGGANVISIAEEMAWPAASAPAIAEQLHALAMAGQVSVLGTGVNPGFVLDTLVLALSGVCADIESITATRVNDLSPYGPTVLHSQGVGLSAEAFRRGLNDGTVVGHIGFVQSLHMIARTLGWELEHIDETREPIVAQQRRETPFVTVEPGQVAGCLHTAVAYRQGQRVIELIHPQQVRPELAGIETGDSIEIRGTPDIRLAGSPEIPGGEGTIALAVNMIHRVLNATPGLHSMADLPLPAAMLGDVRACLHREYGRD
jgi:hypothetical protein